MEKKRIDGLDVLKALGICMVLSLHVPLWDPDFITNPNIVHILQYAARIVSEGVPIFFNNQWDVVVEKEYVFFETTL